jgi:hypothetical protein
MTLGFGASVFFGEERVVHPTSSSIQKVFRFLQPTLWVGLGFLAFCWISSAVDAGRKPTTEGPSGPTALPAISLPSPDRVPEDVVRLQLEGLADTKDPDRGMLQCFWHASPGNRLVTGPLDRFAAMIRREPYGVLTEPQLTAIGRPEILDSEARVMVTIVDQANEVHAFVFVLARQQEAPFEGCWMTEGVFRVRPVESPMQTLAPRMKS